MVGRPKGPALVRRSVSSGSVVQDRQGDGKDLCQRGGHPARGTDQPASASASRRRIDFCSKGLSKIAETPERSTAARRC